MSEPMIDLQSDHYFMGESLRQAARAYAAADGRGMVTPEDLQIVAPMALRLRRSKFMNEYFSSQAGEEEEMQALLAGLGKKRKLITK